MRTAAGPRRWTQQFGALAALAVLSTGVAACGDSGADDSKPAGTGPLAGKTIAFSPLTLQSSLFVKLDDELREAVEAAGGELLTVDPQGDAAKQVQQIQGLVTRGQADGLVVIPLNPAALKPMLTQMQSKGIAGFMVAAPSDFELSSPPNGTSFLSTDWAEYGQVAGEQVSQCIEERLGGSAEVAILGGPAMPGPVVTDRINAMKSAITGGSPGAEIVAEADGESQKLASAQKMAAILQAHPDVNAVSGTSDESILGAVQALKQAGKDPTKMCIVGLDATPDGLAAVKDGTFYADVQVDFATFYREAVAGITSGLANPDEPGTAQTLPVTAVTQEG